MSTLKLDKLTPHQEDKLAECRSARRVHIHAPAGAGKTFVALYLMLEALRDSKEVVFVTSNRAVSSPSFTCFFNPSPRYAYPLVGLVRCALVHREVAEAGSKRTGRIRESSRATLLQLLDDR